jgi:hypothetical protein
MGFRPTVTQALGRGATRGGLVSAVVLVLLVAVGLAEHAAWLAVALVLGGAAWGIAFGRGRGTNIDDRGIHPVPAPSAVDAPWHRVADLRPERRGGRTRVAVYLDSGEIALLTAPYDGRLLGRDPEFERKLIMLRHLWDTHRRAAPRAG